MAIKLLSIKIDDWIFVCLENKWSGDRDLGNNDIKGQ